MIDPEDPYPEAEVIMAESTLVGKLLSVDTFKARSTIQADALPGDTVTPVLM